MATADLTVDLDGPPLSLVVVDDDPAEAVVAVRGELDAATTPVLEGVVQDLCAEFDAVALDLSGVTFADLQAYRTLLWLVVAPYGCDDVRVRASSPAVLRLIERVLSVSRAPGSSR